MGKKCKLSELCDVRDGTHDSPEYVQEGYPLVTSKNIVDGRLDLTVVNYISEKDYNHINERSKVDLGDIIMPMIGTIGNPHLIEAIPEFAIKNVALIKFPKSDVLNKFIYYFLQSDAFNTYVAENNRGGTQKFLSLKDIRNMDIPALPYEKQLEICLVLDKVSELIGLRKEQLAKLDQLVKSRFIELFGDPKTNPNRWPISKLSEFCDLQNGYAFKSDDYLTNSTVLNCRMSNIRPDGGFDAEYHPKYLPDMFWEKYKDYRLLDGDVIIAMTDMASDPKILGVPTIVRTNGKKFLLNQRVGKLTFFDNTAISNVYLMFVLSQKHIRQQLVKSAGGSTQINVGKPAVLAVEFFVPPMELQEQFSAFVGQTDKSKLAIQQSLDKLELLKNSLMQEYFG